MDSLAGLYHDQTEERFVEDLPLEGLPDPYQGPLAGLEPGQVVGPVELERGNGRTLYAAVMFIEARPEGPAEFEDLRDQLWEGLGEENAIRRYIQGLRAATFIDIRI